MTYPYDQGNLFDQPQSYQYSAYQPDLLAQWQRARQSTLQQLDNPRPLSLVKPVNLTNQANYASELLLTNICLELRQGKICQKNEDWLVIFIKKFEVSKRLFTEYETSLPFRPSQGAGYHSLTCYLLLGEALVHQWQQTQASYLLSCLLKLCDSLTSQLALMDSSQSCHFAWLLEKEQAMVLQLMTGNKDETI
ncbi:hypothetical protein K6Y31_12195 [Motilimonas cestriensis]|uniref:Uncharacterized protein n=1 Tax=Motilimonas cestriensis TaxID=2742685 RepID=A0ABS8WCU6_9GAMM|nr:hypothetical protein [Motilimonas cestriensis]MCE2595581.1 hypothetical protein [Motilimonas cestriensis]